MKLENKKNYKITYSSGFTLMEVMLSVSILSMGIVASFSLISSSMAKFSTASNKIIASNLAQDGIERVRNVRDTNWLKGWTEPDNTNGIMWDTDVDGFGGGPNNRDFPKFFCGNSDREYLTSGNRPSPPGPAPHPEKEYIDDCISNSNVGKNCKVFVYINTSDSSIKCYGDDFSDSSNPYGGYNGVQYFGFYRLIHIEELNDYSNKVSVTIKWTDRTGMHYFTASEVLYNWKETD